MSEANATENPSNAAVAEQATTPAASGAADELATVRELILKAHPDALPELVNGATIAELQASIEPARAAFNRVAEQIKGSAAAAVETAVATTAKPEAPTIPAGGAVAVVDLSKLPPGELIKRGIAQRTARAGS